MKKKIILTVVIVLMLSMLLNGCANSASAPKDGTDTDRETDDKNQAEYDDKYYELYRKFVEETLIPKYGVVNSYCSSGRDGGLAAARIYDMNNDGVPELLTYINHTLSSTDGASYVDSLQMYALDEAGKVEFRQQHEYTPFLPEGCTTAFLVSMWKYGDTPYVMVTASKTFDTTSEQSCIIYSMGHDIGIDQETGESKLRLPIAASTLVKKLPGGNSVGFPDAPAALREKTGEYSVYFYKDFQELYGWDYGKTEPCNNIGSCATPNEALSLLKDELLKEYGISYDKLMGCAMDNASAEAIEAQGNVLLYGVDQSGNVYSGDMMGICEQTDEQNRVSTSVNTVGNTTANIMNGGSMAQQGDELYFLTDNYGVKICTGKIDSTEYQYLCKADAFYLNVIGDWLYFFCEGRFSQGGGPRRGIYKMRLDGSDLTLLRSEHCYMLYATAERLYALFYSPDTTKQDLCIEEMDLDGNYITEYRGLNNYEFALYNDYIYFFKSKQGICRLDTKSGEVTLIIKPSISWFRVIGDKLFYIMEKNNYKAVYMCDMDGRNSECVMPYSVHWIKSGLIIDDEVLHCDGRYLYFFGTIDSYDNTNSKHHAYDPRSGKVIDLPIPHGSSFSIVGDWICGVDDNYAEAKRYSKAELGLINTEPYWELSATGTASENANHTYSSVSVIKNAQIIYDMVESNAGSQGGSIQYLKNRILEAQGYRNNLMQAYKGIQFNKKVLAIEDLSIDAVLTIGSICTANAAGTASGVSAAADAVIDSAENLLDTGLSRVIDNACLTTNDFVFCITQMANTGTFALFANLHTATDRNNMTKEEAQTYITAFYGAKMDMQTLLMGYLYFNEQLPAGFLDKLKTSLTTSLFSLGGFIAGQYVPQADSIASKTAQKLAKSTVNFFAGKSTELFESVAMLNNEIITDWGHEMRVLQKALTKALDE